MIDGQHNNIRAALGVLPLYGLADWPGPRMIGPWGWANGVLDTAGLAFGVPREPAPWAEVVSTAGPAEGWVADRRFAEAFEPEQISDGEAFRHLFEQVRAARSEELTVEADGTARTFQHWSGAVWYAALAGEPGLAIVASGIDPHEIRLVTVTDIEPYFAASRQFLLGRYDAASDR